MTKSSLDVLDELEAVGGRLKKEAIINREKNNEVLQKIFYAVGNPYLVFFVNKFTRQVPIAVVRTPEQIDENVAGYIQLLLSLSRREMTGNAARFAIEGFLAHSTTQEQKWMERILLKNLRCGVQDSTVGKTWPDLLPSFSVQLAHVLQMTLDKENKHVTSVSTPLTYPICFEPKLDGFRLVTMKFGGVVKLFTRNGNELDTLPELAKILEAATYDDFVLDGEIFGTDWSVSASVVLSEKNLKDETLLNYYVFDAVPSEDWTKQECAIPYVDRRRRLAEILTSIRNPRIQPVLGKDVENEAEMIELYELYLAEGWEGGMVKELTGTYDFKRSKSVLKMKPEHTFEGVVVGFYFGKQNTKNEGRFGGFEVVVQNEAVTRVGGGFSDVLRNQIFEEGPNSYIGRIVEFKGQPDMTTEDRTSKDGKVRFPVFVRFRDSKDVDPQLLTVAKKFLKSGDG